MYCKVLDLRTATLSCCWAAGRGAPTQSSSWGSGWRPPGSSLHSSRLHSASTTGGIISVYCKVLDLRTATPRGEVSMTRLLGSTERGAHPELQLGLGWRPPGSSFHSNRSHSASTSGGISFHGLLQYFSPHGASFPAFSSPLTTYSASDRTSGTE